MRCSCYDDGINSYVGKVQMKKEEVKTLYFTPDISINVAKINYKNMNLYEIDGKSFIILEKNFINDFSTASFLQKNDNVNIKSKPYGKFDNFIVDMNGIDNFISAREMVFRDSFVRKLILMHHGVNNKSYDRFGVSGSRPNSFHPGGEVVEIQSIDFSANIGIANSVSGHLNLPDNEYSRMSMLSEDGKELRDERTVYSHTAWIEANSANKPFIVQAKIERANSLLTFLYDFCRNCGINAAGIRLHIKGNNDITFRGRVLKHIPQNKFEELQEATDIAVEKEFRIPETCELFMCGTLYNRYEPYWREFTGGRQYEKRGHYHAAVFGEGFKDIHETFHVRDIMTEATVAFEIECFPVDKVYRIYPVVFKNNQYVISSFEESVDAFAEKFNNSASKL